MPTFSVPTMSSLPVWPLLLIFGYPIVMLAVLEIARRIASHAPITSEALRHAGYVLLPAGAIWLVLTSLAGMPDSDLSIRVAKTVFAITAVYVVLNLAQGWLLSVIGDNPRSPKLLLDILRVAIVMFAAAVVVSTVWDVDLGKLVAALGVGSLVIGFAMQDVAGNFISGLAMLSSHKFNVGDWIKLDGAMARVDQLDWRAVTLVTASGERIVVANSTLSKSNTNIAARAGEKAWAEIVLELTNLVPPERVRASVMEAGAAMPDYGPGDIRCFVTGFSPDIVRYSVQLRVSDPSVILVPRDEFLSRFWYVAQRNNVPLRLGPEWINTPDETPERLRQLRTSALFRHAVVPLEPIAQTAHYRRYRAGEVVRTPGDPMRFAFVVLSGALRVTVRSEAGEAPLETTSAGQVFMLKEALDRRPSPVCVSADTDTDMLAVPIEEIMRLTEVDPRFARDVRAILDVRQKALVALTSQQQRAA